MKFFIRKGRDNYALFSDLFSEVGYGVFYSMVTEPKRSFAVGIYPTYSEAKRVKIVYEEEHKNNSTILDI